MEAPLLSTSTRKRRSCSTAQDDDPSDAISLYEIAGLLHAANSSGGNGYAL